MIFSAAERPDSGLFASQKGLICSKNGLLKAPKGVQNIPNWVSDAYPVKLGQLDHFVEFGTTFGHVEDFQRGKNRPIRVD